MKKFTAVFLLASMLVTFCTPAFATDFTRRYETVTSTIDIPIGEEKNVRFISVGSGAVTLKSNGMRVGAFTDSGFGADERRNDGVRSIGMTLSSDTRKTEKYQAYEGDKLIAEYTVNYYRELTAEDFELKSRINKNVADIEAAFAGKSEKALYDAVYDYVSECDDIVSVGRTENSISYTTEAGITSVFTQFKEGYKGAGEGVSLSTEDGMNSEKTLSWTNPDILVLRPFRNSISDTGAGFGTDVYYDAANVIKGSTGGQIFMYDDEEANPYNLVDKMDKVGFVLIDSHGIDINYNDEMVSTIVLENTNNDGIDSADWSSGRIFDMYSEGLVTITGEFVKAKYEQQGRRLENTMIHVGVCLGMKYDTIYKPFYELGAGYIDGYTETVSIWYDANCLITIANQITRKTAANNTRSYNFTEAIAVAKEKFGQEDPAGWGAVIKTYGNENMTCVVPDTGVDTVTLADFEATVNNYETAPLTVTVNGENAYGYTQEWSSSDESVLKVTANRTVMGVKEGSATLTCRIKSNTGTIEKSCTVTVKYIPAESVKLLLKQTSMSVGSMSVARSVIYPRTSSEKSRTLISTNPGTIKLTNGRIYTMRPGSTYIVVTTESGLTDSKKISVSNKAAYMSVSEAVPGQTYALHTTDNFEYSVVLNNKKSGSYLSGTDVRSNFGYITTTLSDKDRWITEGSTDGFYIKNIASGQYLSLENGKIALTDNAISTFVQESGSRLKVANTEETNCYLRYQNGKGFSFSSKAQASKISFMKMMSYSDDELFATVKFEMSDGSYVDQRVEKGTSAVAATPVAAKGMTFRGYDIPLCNIQNDVTAKALWKEGSIADGKVLVTFMYTDGTVIEQKEFNKGAKITPPAADPERNGLPFAYWSENLSKADVNMTVFAIYEEQYVMGDVNADGSVNTSDAVQILKASANMLTLNSTSALAADVNHDGNVNTSDAVVILKYAAGMITNF